MKKSLIALIAILLISTVLSGCSKESRSESSAAEYYAFEVTGFY